MAKPSNIYSGDQALIALGAAIRLARREVSLSQEGLAADAEMDRSYVGGIERGEHNLTIMNLKKLADALRINPSKLLESAGL
jgi:transcriptional regulator with XRE-family HTH domain